MPTILTVLCGIRHGLVLDVLWFGCRRVLLDRLMVLGRLDGLMRRILVRSWVLSVWLLMLCGRLYWLWLRILVG